MKLKGEVELWITDSITGEVKRHLKVPNVIPNDTLLDLLTWNADDEIFAHNNISLSQQQDEPTLENSTLTEVIATGYEPSNVTSPTWHNTVDPPFGQLCNRIDPVGYERSFSTVGLTDRVSRNIEADITTQTFAYVALSTSANGVPPCIQGENDFVDVCYRIQFADYGMQGFLDPDRARNDFGKFIFELEESGGFLMSYLYASPVNLPVGYKNPWTFAYPIAYRDERFGNVIGWDGGTRIDDHFKWKYQISIERDDYVGVIFNTMLQGRSDVEDVAYTVNKFEYNLEPFQTGFWHTANAPGPFFDPAYVGISSGIITLSGNWTGSWPTIYKIDIIATGEVGTATYKLSTLKHWGFQGNTYEHDDNSAATFGISTGNPFRNPNIAAAEGMHGWRDEDNDLLRFSDTQIVQYDQTGATLLDLVTGEYFNYTVGLDIRQCATDGSKIYCACRSTGLHIIDTVTNTATNPITAGCYGVDVGVAGKVWAIASGGLYNSSDGYSAPAAFSYAGITGNWSSVWFLKADPEHADNHIAIVHETSSGNNQIVWWDEATGTSAPGYTDGGFGVSHVRSWPSSLDVSDTGSVWVGEANGVRILTYGSNSTSGSLSVIGRSLDHSIWGNHFFKKVAFYEDKLIGENKLYDRNGNVVSNYRNIYNNQSYTATNLHLTGGIVITDRGVRQLFTNNDLSWQHYGWNGSSWELDHAGTKVIHPDAQDLVEGIQIQFANSGGITEFLAGEHFTQGINWGLLKDNATELYYESQWYTKPTQFDSTHTETIPASLTITLPAASDPDFVRLETDSPQLHQFLIDGNLAVTVYAAGTTPAPGEVSIDPSGNGLMLFNAADVGKNFQAIYTWIKN